MEKNEILAKLQQARHRLQNLSMCVAELGFTDDEINEKFYMAKIIANSLKDLEHEVTICKEDIEENLKDKVTKDKYKVA